MTKLLRFPEGTVISAEGDHEHVFMVFIVEGNAALYRSYKRSQEERVGLLLTGDFFGEESLLLGIAPTLSLVALTDVVAMVLEPQNARAYFAKTPNMAFEVMSRLCGKLVSVTKNYNALATHLSHGQPVPAMQPLPPMQPVKPIPPPIQSHPPVQPSPPAKPATAPQSSLSVQDAAAFAAKIQPDQNAAVAALVASVAASAATAPAPKAAPSAAPAAPQTETHTPSALFPAGHRSDYLLQLKNEDRTYLSPREMDCPLCGNHFKYLKTRAPKLMVEKNDFDLRVHYRDIEPMYYDLLTCPKCLYSALCEIFPKAMSSRRKRVEALIDPLRGDLTGLTFGLSLNTPAVFAGYYLALLCAPVCFSDHEMITAGLWLKISRIYEDCGDDAMLRYAAEKAQKAYIDAFSRLNIDPSKTAQLYLTIGALSMKIGDMASAKNFLYKAKTDKQSPPAIREKADILIEDIRAGK